jgi:hypothetical protein
MTKKTEHLSAEIASILASGDAKTLTGMRAMLEHYAVLAALEADEEKAIGARRRKLRRQHRALGVPAKRARA